MRRLRSVCERNGGYEVDRRNKDEVDAAIALEKDPPKEEAKAFIAKAWFPTSSGERVVPGLGTYRKRWQSFWQSQPHLDLAPLTIVSRIL